MHHKVYRVWRYWVISKTIAPIPSWHGMMTIRHEPCPMPTAWGMAVGNRWVYPPYPPTPSCPPFTAIYGDDWRLSAIAVFYGGFGGLWWVFTGGYVICPSPPSVVMAVVRFSRPHTKTTRPRRGGEKAENSPLGPPQRGGVSPATNHPPPRSQR